MRDIVLMRLTLSAMRDLGDDQARLVQVMQSYHAWHAGPQSLNHQAVHDLISDGWVKRRDDRTLKIDAWPGFAGPALKDHCVG